MAQRDELGRAFRPADPGDARGREHVGLRQVVGAHEAHDLGGGLEPSAGDRDPGRLRLAADVDHPGTSVAVEVAELAHSVQTVTSAPAGRSDRVGRDIDEHVGSGHPGDQVRTRAGDLLDEAGFREPAAQELAFADDGANRGSQYRPRRPQSRAARRLRAGGRRRKTVNETCVLTGLPGKHTTGTPSTSAVACGPPGCMAIVVTSAPQRFEDLAHHLERALGDAARGHDQIARRDRCIQDRPESGRVVVAGAAVGDGCAGLLDQRGQRDTVRVEDLPELDGAVFAHQLGSGREDADPHRLSAPSPAPPRRRRARPGVAGRGAFRTGRRSRPAAGRSLARARTRRARATG